MKKIAFLLLIITGIMVSSCNDDLTDEGYICNECSGLFSERQYVWIANKLTPNPDNPDEYCMKVQFDSYESDTSWIPFCDEICGFDYQAGFVYELYIEKKKIDEDQDGNPIYKYCLLRIVSQDPMPMKK